jgi:hypothetical protein
MKKEEGLVNFITETYNFKNKLAEMLRKDVFLTKEVEGVAIFLDLDSFFIFNSCRLFNKINKKCCFFEY